MKTQSGFTLIELAVVTSVIITLLGFITITLVRSQQSASLNSTEEILLVDLRQQQLKSMTGDAEDRTTSDSYGIHFDSNKYVFFHGSTYSDSDSANSIINLSDDMQFNTTNLNVIFSKLSGTTSATIIDLQDKTNLKVRRIHLNAFGIATQIESL